VLIREAGGLVSAVFAFRPADLIQVGGRGKARVLRGRPRSRATGSPGCGADV
jgi:hypothetical protein